MARKCPAWLSVVSIYFGYLTAPDLVWLSFVMSGKMFLTELCPSRGGLFQLVVAFVGVSVSEQEGWWTHTGGSLRPQIVMEP